MFWKSLYDRSLILNVQMGYGARALKALNAYYSGEYLGLQEDVVREPTYADAGRIDPVSHHYFKTVNILILNEASRLAQ
jgi:hypothetical protein